MKCVLAVALAAAAGSLLACGSARGRTRTTPPEPDLRIWAPPVIRWSAGADRTVQFAIENGTQRTLEVPPPDPGLARVAVFADGEARACGVEPSERSPVGTVRLGPGDQVPMRIDLAEQCGTLQPGEYRYELSYRAPKPGGGAVSLSTWYGTLVVEGPSRAARRAGAPAPRPGRRGSH